jgi:hypothetical protein
MCRSRGNVLSRRLATSSMTEGSEFKSRGGKNFRFSVSSRPALASTQPPIQWVPGILSPGVRRLGRETSLPTNTEVKKMWIYTSTPPIRLHGVVLSQAQGQLYFTLPHS